MNENQIKKIKSRKSYGGDGNRIYDTLILQGENKDNLEIYNELFTFEGYSTYDKEKQKRYNFFIKILKIFNLGTELLNCNNNDYIEYKENGKLRYIRLNKTSQQLELLLDNTFYNRYFNENKDFQIIIPLNDISIMINNICIYIDIQNNSSIINQLRILLSNLLRFKITLNGINFNTLKSKITDENNNMYKEYKEISDIKNEFNDNITVVTETKYNYGATETTNTKLTIKNEDLNKNLLEKLKNKIILFNNKYNCLILLGYTKKYDTFYTLNLELIDISNKDINNDFKSKYNLEKKQEEEKEKREKTAEKEIEDNELKEFTKLVDKYKQEISKNPNDMSVVIKTVKDIKEKAENILKREEYIDIENQLFKSRDPDRFGGANIKKKKQRKLKVIK
jgi:hypothetical protein